GLLHWLTSPFRFIANNGSRLLLPRYWSLNAIKRVLQKPIVVPARYIVDAATNGPAARAAYLQRVENDRSNFLAMSQLASFQLFPDYNFKYSKLADRGLFTLNLWRQRKQRKEENRLFNDLSSKDSPLYPTLRSAADAYIKMTAAVARGDTTTLPQYAGKKYLATVAKRARQVADKKHKTNYQWQFEKWIQDPQCISIRSDDIFLCKLVEHKLCGTKLTLLYHKVHGGVRTLFEGKVATRDLDRYSQEHGFQIDPPNLFKRYSKDKSSSSRGMMRCYERPQRKVMQQVKTKRPIQSLSLLMLRKYQSKYITASLDEDSALEYREGAHIWNESQSMLTTKLLRQCYDTGLSGNEVIPYSEFNRSKDTLMDE
ncbi:4315_t:CDS:2, partial [Acaulospora colombiana]